MRCLREALWSLRESLWRLREPLWSLRESLRSLRESLWSLREPLRGLGHSLGHLRIELRRCSARRHARGTARGRSGNLRLSEDPCELADSGARSSGRQGSRRWTPPAGTPKIERLCRAGSSGTGERRSRERRWSGGNVGFPEHLRKLTDFVRTAGAGSFRNGRRWNARGHRSRRGSILEEPFELRSGRLLAWRRGLPDRSFEHASKLAGLVGSHGFRGDRWCPRGRSLKAAGELAWPGRSRRRRDRRRRLGRRRLEHAREFAALGSLDDRGSRRWNRR